MVCLYQLLLFLQQFTIVQQNPGIPGRKRQSMIEHFLCLDKISSSVKLQRHMERVQSLSCICCIL